MSEEQQETVDGTAVEEPAADGPERPQEAAGGDAGAAATSDAGTGAEASTAALAVRESSDVFRVMDQADADQILDELQGRLLATMLYKFKQGGSWVTDLSYAGVLEVIRRLNAAGHQIKISAEPAPQLAEIVEEDDTYYRAIVYAHDARTGMGQFGLAKQSKHKGKGEKRQRDPFAETIALNKAQRNALRSFVPEEWRQTLIAQYSGDASKVRKLSAAGGGKVAELPPPLEDDEAKALLATIRERYDELKGISRLVMPPAKFNSYLTQVQHDHGRMREFVAHLEQLVADAKGSP